MKLVTILSLITLLMIGFVYFYLFGDSSNMKQQLDKTAYQEQSLSADITVRPESGVSTLNALRLKGEDLECQITYTPDEYDASSKVTGTYFVSAGKMRGDFLTDAPDLSGQVLSSMIVSGDIMYVWSEIEGETYGVKKNISLKNDATVRTNESVGLDVDVKYICQAWENVDPSVFTPPATVLFRDADTLLQTGMEYGTTYESEMEISF